MSGGKFTYTLVATHRSGATKLYRRSDGRLVRVTTYPEDGPSGHRGTCMVAVPDTYLSTVRGWSTWTVLEDGEGRLL